MKPIVTAMPRAATAVLAFHVLGWAHQPPAGDLHGTTGQETVH